MNEPAITQTRGDLPDETLAELAVRGAGRARGDAFEALYRRHVDRVFGYCFRLLGSRELAEDATSDVFMAVMQGLERYRPMNGKSFRSWLFTIAHHVAVDHRTERSRDSARTAPLDPNQPDSTASPFDLAAASDEGRWIRATLSHLSGREREVLELDLAGLTTREIGFVLGLTDAAVYTARSRALVTLRDHLTGRAASGGGQCD